MEKSGPVTVPASMAFGINPMAIAGPAIGAKSQIGQMGQNGQIGQVPLNPKKALSATSNNQAVPLTTSSTPIKGIGIPAINIIKHPEDLNTIATKVLGRTYTIAQLRELSPSRLAYMYDKIFKELEKSPKEATMSATKTSKNKSDSSKEESNSEQATSQAMIQ